MTTNPKYLNLSYPNTFQNQKVYKLTIFQDNMVAKELSEEQLEILKQNDTFKNLFEILQDMQIRLSKMENLLNGKVNKSIEQVITQKIDTILEEHKIHL